MPSSPRMIMEGTVIPIRDFIKANIDAALAKVRTDRSDSKVTLESPKDYFIFDQAVGYRCPAIFVLGDSANFNLSAGQNFIAAKIAVFVSVLVEDRNAELLAFKCWRYQDALHEILDNAILDQPGESIKNIVKVVRAEYSNTFKAKAQNPGDSQNPFRKEVMLTLEVEHLEQK